MVEQDRILSFSDKAVIVPVGDIKPYKHNPRKNDRAVEMVQKSIEEFGFLQPIVCDKDGIIIVGHTRYKAAKNMGLETVPVIYAKNLTDAQAKAFRLVDNKTSELAAWDTGDLIKEIEELENANYEITDYGFEHWEDMHKRAQWELNDRRCDLKKDVKLRTKSGFWYVSLFKTSKTGDTLLEIKENPENVEPFGYCVLEFIETFFGGSLKNGDYCIATAPVRRHREFHFATSICEMVAEKAAIPFYGDLFASGDHKHYGSVITLNRVPDQHNVIWFDDIMTTGSTSLSCRSLLTEQGFNVFVIIGIRCQ